jgi:hypothetical protein
VRRRSAFLALSAVLLQAFAPLLAGAAPGAAVDHMEICTAQGVVQVAVDADNAPGQSTVAPEHCPACATHGAVAAPALRPQAQQPASAVPIAVRQPAAVFVAAYPASRPRAPPASS